MSKKKSKKKKPQRNKPQQKKMSAAKKIAAAAVAVLIVAGIAVGAVIFNRIQSEKEAEAEKQDIKNADYVGREFKSVKAFNSDGEDVDLQDIHNMERYDNYTGTLNFKADSTFSLWMTAGPKDGSQNGTFTYEYGKNEISAKYENGTETTFKFVRDKEGNLEHIETKYGDYTVWFS